jgi:hypothetical protein
LISLYYDPAKPSAFSTLQKIQSAAAAVKNTKIQKRVGDINEWLLNL